jgi:hypothetical protein
VAAAPVRELSAPVAFRALVQATLPGLKEVEAGGPRPQREAWIRRWGPLFDDGRDRPASQPQGGIQRALWLMNGAPATDLLRGRKEGLAWRLVHANTTDEKAIQDVYLTVLARAPAEGELTVAKKALPPKPKDAKKQGSWKKARIEAIEDLVWALINGDEFLVNH